MPMRIGLLCYPTHGGSGVIASELAASLAVTGDDVHLFSHGVPPRLAKSNSGVRLHIARGAPYPLFERAPHELALASRVVEEHTRAPFDLLHAHYALPHAIVAWLAREAAPAPAPRIVTTLHGTDTSLVGAAPEYAPLLHHALSVSDAVTAVSEHLAVEAGAAFGLRDSRKPLVIHDFVDVERFRPAEERVPRPLRVVHVSNFRPLKQVPWLVEAFGDATRGTDTELCLIGEGPDRKRSQDCAARLDLSARVRFMGARDDLPTLLPQADVFALASEQESFGLSALEAMSCGLPVIAPEVGGLPEVLTDGTEGRLVPPADRAAWSTALRELLEDEVLRARMANAARTRAVERFAREGVVASYRELYRSMLEA